MHRGWFLSGRSLHVRSYNLRDGAPSSAICGSQLGVILAPPCYRNLGEVERSVCDFWDGFGTWRPPLAGSSSATLDWTDDASSACLCVGALPRFLLTVVYYHHVLKGFVLMYVFTSFDWVLASYHVRGPRLQALKTIALLPWVLKPLLGIISDMFPIFGFNKAPYFILATWVGCTACALVGFEAFLRSTALAQILLPASHECTTVLAFFCVGLQICTCDLLLEAAVAERVRKLPDRGPLLMGFVTGGQTVGEALAIGTVGWILEYLGPRGPCMLSVPLTFLAFLPAVFNWLGESKRTFVETAAIRKAFFAATPNARSGGGELPFLVGAMGLGSLAILFVATSTDNDVAEVVDPLAEATDRLELVALVAVLIVAAFSCLLNPTIGRLNAFFFLQSTSTISLEGGAFYFFTDDSTSYPMGPHFSVWFYTTGLGIAASFFGIMGLGVYSTFMTDWSYRSLLYTSNALWCLVSTASVVVFTRKNMEWGVPDTTFMLGGTVLQTVFARWTYIPAGLLLCQVCPSGLESTMFALLAGCHNLGRSVASIFGTYLLAYLGVEPDGTVHDQHCFDRLWVAAAFQALAPLITLCIIPSMIPNVSQTQRLDLQGGPSGDMGSFAEDGDPAQSMAAATRDSIWSSCCLWWAKNSMHDSGARSRAVLPGALYGSTEEQAGLAAC